MEVGLKIFAASRTHHQQWFCHATVEKGGRRDLPEFKKLASKLNIFLIQTFKKIFCLQKKYLFYLTFENLGCWRDEKGQRLGSVYLVFGLLSSSQNSCFDRACGSLFGPSFDRTRKKIFLAFSADFSQKASSPRPPDLTNPCHDFHFRFKFRRRLRKNRSKPKKNF